MASCLRQGVQLMLSLRPRKVILACADSGAVSIPVQQLEQGLLRVGAISASGEHLATSSTPASVLPCSSRIPLPIGLIQVTSSAHRVSPQLQGERILLTGVNMGFWLARGGRAAEFGEVTLF